MKHGVMTSLILVVTGLLVSGSFVLAGDPIKIGVIYPLTGPAAAAGSYQKAGVEIARDKFNG